MSSTFDTKCDRCGSTPAKRALGPVIQLDINTRPDRKSTRLNSSH